MYIRLTLVLAAAFVFCADLPDTDHFRMPLPGSPDASSLPDAPSVPEVFVAVVHHPSNRPTNLRPESRLAIIRFVDGEFARVLKPLPGGKKGFRVVVGKPLDEKGLRNAVASNGAAANPGDTVQITAIEFRPKEIVFQVNGGGKKHYHLRDHLQIGFGGSPVQTSSSSSDSTPSGQDSREGNGSTLILDFGRSLPDMSPDDLKQALSTLLDFSKEHSAAVNWVETLPPQFKQAIKERQAVVGMDHEMVIAALGRPDHKVRERDSKGDETEDWIYGTPPAKTIFVTFEGDKVTRVKEFN